MIVLGFSVGHDKGAVIIKDNYSKFILHKGIVPNGDSKWIAKLLEEMYLKLI
jgi:hypothetical protein